jgi:hypothetical protein
MKKETLINPFSGYPMVLAQLIILAIALFGLITIKNPWFIKVSFFMIYDL